MLGLKSRHVGAREGDARAKFLLRKTVANHESYIATMQIRAPFAGRVTNRQLPQMAGAFLKTGDEVVQIGRADGSEVKIAVSEEQEPHFRTAVEKPVRVRIVGRGGDFPAVLTRVEARASRGLVHPALTAVAGGPLALRRAEGESAGEQDRKAQFELARPHFTAIAHLDAAEGFSVGEMARVRLRSTRTVTVWSELQRVVDRWLGKYTERAG